MIVRHATGIDNNPFELSAADRRQAARREEAVQAAERQRHLAAQAAPHRDPQQRIKIWEQLHAMWLPREPNHRLVGVIAAQTALTVEQIQAEQRRRATPAAPAVESTPATSPTA
jgi:hypothetical protein